MGNIKTISKSLATPGQTVSYLQSHFFVAPSILDGPNINTAIKTPLPSHGYTSKAFSEKTLESLKLLLTVSGVSLKKALSIN